MMIYPFRFEPIFRQYIWGGRRLQSVLGKNLGAGMFAESWEVVDRTDSQSIVANGRLKGQTLHGVLREHRVAVMGRHAATRRFPLLLKFLDCHQNLSVQVHPDDARAALLNPPDLGKTEAWVVIDAEPGGKIYAGLQARVDRAYLAAAIDEGTILSCLHSFEPQVGDCVFIPAGVVHALGAGLLIAEIQQSSDTTYRLFDWNRVAADGQARELHIDRGLEAIDYNIGPVRPQSPRVTWQSYRQRLVECDKFALDRLHLVAGEQAVIESDDRVHLLATLSGEVDVDQEPDARPLVQGETLMLPAALGQRCLRARQDATLLDIYLP
jgi:mannose-6-phosphate isomerase